MGPWSLLAQADQQCEARAGRARWVGVGLWARPRASRSPWAAKGDSILGGAQGLMVRLPAMPGILGLGKPGPDCSHGHCPAGNLLGWVPPGVGLPTGSLPAWAQVPPQPSCSLLLGEATAAKEIPGHITPQAWGGGSGSLPPAPPEVQSWPCCSLLPGLPCALQATVTALNSGLSL